MYCCSVLYISYSPKAHLQAQRALLHLFDEAPHHRQAHVGLQQRTAHVTQRALRGDAGRAEFIVSLCHAVVLGFGLHHPAAGCRVRVADAASCSCVLFLLASLIGYVTPTSECLAAGTGRPAAGHACYVCALTQRAANSQLSCKPAQCAASCCSTEHCQPAAVAAVPHLHVFCCQLGVCVEGLEGA